MTDIQERLAVDPTAVDDDYPAWMGTEKEWQEKMRNTPVDIEAAQKRINEAYTGSARRLENQ